MVGSSRSIDILDYLKQVMKDPSVRTDTVVTDYFISGGILFALVTMARTATLRQSDTDFGLLPIPKYDNNQEKYIQYSDAYCPNVISFPVTNIEKLDMASFVVEALAIESVETVTPEFYEICLKTKNARDEELSRMIDIIFSNYTIDLADVYLTIWANFRGAIINAISAGTNITTVIEANRTRVNNLIAMTVEVIVNAGG